MKKLLLLGGSINAIQIIDAAHNLGVEVGVVDYYDSSECKKLADYTHKEDVFNIDAVCKIIRDCGYDGIITGYSEALLLPYAKICEESGKPCYGSSALFSLSTNKAKFKGLCKKYSVPTMPEYTCESVLEDNIFPVVVKPIDNAGGIGISISNNYTEFTQNYRNALAASPSKNVIIEKCASGKEATLFFFFDNGSVHYTLGSDRIMLKQEGVSLPLPVGYIFIPDVEEKLLDDFISRLTDLFHGEGFANGMAFAQVFIEDNGIYLCEIGFRLTPSFETFAIKELYNFDPITALVNFALGNEVDTSHLNSMSNHEVLGNMTILLNEGIISEYNGIEGIMQLPYIIKVLPAWEIGHEINVKDKGTLKQVGLRVILKGDDKEHLISRMDKILSYVKIFNETGEDMVIRNYTYKELCK